MDGEMLILKVFNFENKINYFIFEINRFSLGAPRLPHTSICPTIRFSLICFGVCFSVNGFICMKLHGGKEIVTHLRLSPRGASCVHARPVITSAGSARTLLIWSKRIPKRRKCMNLNKMYTTSESSRSRIPFIIGYGSSLVCRENFFQFDILKSKQRKK